MIQLVIILVQLVIILVQLVIILVQLVIILVQLVIIFVPHFSRMRRNNSDHAVCVRVLSDLPQRMSRTSVYCYTV